MLLRLSLGRSLTPPNATPLRLSCKKLGHRRSPHPIAAPYDLGRPKMQALEGDQTRPQLLQLGWRVGLPFPTGKAAPTESDAQIFDERHVVRRILDGRVRRSVRQRDRIRRAAADVGLVQG